MLERKKTIKELLDVIKSLPQNNATRNIKAGLRNINDDIKNVGYSNSGAYHNAERYLAAHTKKC